MEDKTKLPELITAPFTEEQVEALNYYQTLGFVHEYACRGSHKADRTLVATKEGWVCKKCSYRQTFALKWMGDLEGLKESARKFKERFNL